MEHARVAAARRDWPEAYKRWELVRTSDNHPQGYLGMAQATLGMGRPDEAREILKAARFRFPINPGPAIELARLAEAQGDLAEILECWKVVRDRFPMTPVGHIDGAKALVAAGHIDEAETILRDAADRFKDNPGLLADYARIAHNRRDWPEASRRWEALRTRFPNIQDGYRRGAEALAALGQTAEAEAVRTEQARRFGR
jgi:predicted Zn-dependent protease